MTLFQSAELHQLVSKVAAANALLERMLNPSALLKECYNESYSRSYFFKSLEIFETNFEQIFETIYHQGLRLSYDGTMPTSLEKDIQMWILIQNYSKRLSEV